MTASLHALSNVVFAQLPRHVRLHETIKRCPGRGVHTDIPLPDGAVLARDPQRVFTGLHEAPLLVAPVIRSLAARQRERRQTATMRIANREELALVGFPHLRD